MSKVEKNLSGYLADSQGMLWKMYTNMICCSISISVVRNTRKIISSAKSGRNILHSIFKKLLQIKLHSSSCLSFFQYLLAIIKD